MFVMVLDSCRSQPFRKARFNTDKLINWIISTAKTVIFYFVACVLRIKNWCLQSKCACVQNMWAFAERTQPLNLYQCSLLPAGLQVVAILSQG